MSATRTKVASRDGTAPAMAPNALAFFVPEKMVLMARTQHDRMRQLSVAMLLLAMVVLLAFSGCATTATTLKQARGGPGERLDPWENWNRKVFGFNEDLDRVVLKPTAIQYARFVPQLVRQGFDNVFSNFADGWSAVNNILQGKATPAFDDTVRFTTNSFFGIFGIFDVASEIGIERHYEDFGQTLGVWGFGPGAYLVWPLLGPSTVRDTAALPLDRAVTPTLVLSDIGPQIGVSVVHVINTRARLLGASNVIDDISLDKYTFIRDAYLQRRRALQYDGDPPPGGAVPSSGTAVNDSVYAPYDPGPTQADPAKPEAPSTPAPGSEPVAPEKP